MQDILHQFIEGIRNTTLLEYIAVVFGIGSVYFSRKENILVYPVGLVNTIIYIYLSFDGALFGEASVNLYYTIMSIYGWWIWAKKDVHHQPEVKITRSGKKDWIQQIAFFLFFYITIWTSLTLLRTHFSSGTLPVADAFASATAFTGMWLMARKKVESWYWWIATNIASIPLYFVKGYVFTSVYYLILLFMAISGLSMWIRKSNEASDTGMKDKSKSSTSYGTTYS